MTCKLRPPWLVFCLIQSPAGPLPCSQSDGGPKAALVTSQHNACTRRALDPLHIVVSHQHRPMEACTQV